MNRVLLTVSAVLLAFGSSGCTAEAPGTGALTVPGAATIAEVGDDIGNGRPEVSFDGPMVRRRVVIAIQPAAETDLIALRNRLERAASSEDTTLSDISPTVLDAAALEGMFPELTVVLAEGASLEDARGLVERATASGPERAGPGSIEIASVLVHDLQFSVRSDDPAALRESIAREGILSDALGNYDVTSAEGGLRIAYTGSLLSDPVVGAVREGIARAAGADADAVLVLPRSASGPGVDMATEPELSVAPEPPSPHDHSVTLSAPTVQAGATPFWGIAGAVFGAWVLTLSVLLWRRMRESSPATLGAEHHPA